MEQTFDVGTRVQIFPGEVIAILDDGSLLIEIGGYEIVVPPAVVEIDEDTARHSHNERVIAGAARAYAQAEAERAAILKDDAA